MSASEQVTATSSAESDTGNQLFHVRQLVAVATSHLLGDTIRLSDAEWREPSLLPTWTRGHVATHIARQADGLGRLAEWARTSRRQEMYASAEQRDADIEAGAGRSGLDLQTDLDTSAGRLAAAFEALDEAGRWDEIVELRGGSQIPARLLPIARLTEVVLHHVDLDVGYDIDDLDAQLAEWLLEWCAFRLTAKTEFPKLMLHCDSGVQLSAGRSGEPVVVSGSSARLLGWLAGRSAPDTVSGAGGLVLPPY